MGVRVGAVGVHVVSVLEPSPRSSCILLRNFVCLMFARARIMDIVSVRIAVMAIGSLSIAVMAIGSLRTAVVIIVPVRVTIIIVVNVGHNAKSNRGMVSCRDDYVKHVTPEPSRLTI